MEKVSIWRTDYYALIPKGMMDDVREKNPKKEVSIHFDTQPELPKLEDDESVCFGDGESFVFILKHR